MSLRPLPARWFELLTARDDLTLAVETLAKTGAVELQTHSETTTQQAIPDLHGRMEEYNRLLHRYEPYWPKQSVQAASLPGRPAHTLDLALGRLYAWRDQADPLIREWEALRSEQTELRLLQEMLAQPGGPTLDLPRLTQAGPSLAGRLYVLPPQNRPMGLPAGVISHATKTTLHHFLAVLGPVREVDALEQELTALKGRRLLLPGGLHGAPGDYRTQVDGRLTEIEQAIQSLRTQLETLGEQHRVAAALGDIARLDWFLTHVSNLPVSENFAWVTGWTSDLSGNALQAALRQTQVRGVLRFPPAPRDEDPPMVMHNPWWAQPFELFARLLGTPAGNEADPSRLLVIIAPLMFGYMFGDVGQGLVLLIAGLSLQRRWPALRLLIAGGLASMLFGLLFGSVFSREDVIAPLWLHPMAEPLRVLIVPLFGGVGILLLGLLLNGTEAYWRGELARWWRLDAAVLLLYVGFVTGFIHLPTGLALAVAGLLWYGVGSALESRRGEMPIGAAILQLLENLMQLVVNTVSFARVGAFALAHAGLSVAIMALADSGGRPWLSAIILVLGNGLVILLEGLVVSIQTTRLVLFEFFIRFLRGEGRLFRPLSAPPSGPALQTRRKT